MASRLRLFILLFYSIFLLDGFTAHSQFYSGSYMQFGKNRVQYDHFDWVYYNYGAYKVYFYTGEEKLAKYAGERTKNILNDVSNFMDYTPDGEFQVIVYDKESEYKQSNIGLTASEQYNTGGVIPMVGRKVVVYFEGDHRKLDEQIRLGVARVLFREMMYGGSVGNIIRSSATLNIPAWFEQGFENYMAYGWNTRLDNILRDKMLMGRYKNISHLAGTDATNAGISLWNYIVQTYGESVIPNILYLTHSTHSIETAFNFVLGTNLKTLMSDWHSYYLTEYRKDYPEDNLPDKKAIVKKPKTPCIYYNLKPSPDGRYVVYCTNQLGKAKVWLYDMQTKKRRKIIKQGEKIDRVTDISYPLIAWHPSGELFSLIMEKQGYIDLYTYTLADHKLQSRRIVDFQKILDYAYSDDGTKFVMSAVQNGQSDIFVFTAASNAFEKITNDVYDDLNPRFIEHSTKIVFSSNRPDDTLRSGGDYKNMQMNNDIYIYNYEAHSRILRRITDAPGVDESDPAPFGGNYISYLSNASGITNRYLAYTDSAISFIDTSAHYRYIVHSYPVTAYTRSILEQNISPSLKNYAEIILYKGKYRMYMDTLAAEPTAYLPEQPRYSYFMSQCNAEQRKKRRYDSVERIMKKDSLLIIKSIQQAPPPVIKLVLPPDTARPKPKDTSHVNPGAVRVNINDYTFEPSPVFRQPAIAPVPAVAAQPAPRQDTTPVKHADSAARKKVLDKQNYYVSFSPDFITAQLDNSFLNQYYQLYNGGAGPIFENPGVGVFLQAGLSDLFEDYRIDGGARLSTDFSNNEYYMSFSDYSHRLDKQLILHRAANTYALDNGYTDKVYTYDGTGIVRWPFSEVARIEVSAGLREDKSITLAQDIPSLETPIGYALTPNSELAFVYDATLPVEINIQYGLRAKVFMQYYRNPGGFANSNLYVFGFDARYYQKISRDLIWANRFSGSTTQGQEQLIYFLGGVDNWFIPNFDNSINVDPNQRYVYQTLATPMRGFSQNIRNGNNFVLYNSELRWPIFHYLVNRPIKSDMLNSFQVLAFTDIGTAWTGLTPYSNENSINQTIVGAPGNPITVILSQKQDPFVEGLGWGVRTRVLGYFVRVDEAWGINNGNFRVPPVWYISLGLDF